MTRAVTAQTLADWPLPGPEASEKHSRGVALVVGGGAETPGAARLAAEAALRAGCGKARIATVDTVAAHLGAALPEARVFGFDRTDSGNLSPDGAAAIARLADDADATLVGSGFTDVGEAEAFVAAVLPSLHGPVVVDALGTAYAGNHRSFRELAGPLVLTLNPSELAHVLDVELDEVEEQPAKALDRLVTESGAVVLLGGETKYVGGPGSPLFQVTAGGPGLATAGSGDVQAGLLTGLLARGADPVQAAVWAAWLHGTAGERLAASVGRLGFLAGELAAEVPRLIDEVGASAGRREA